jgi:solute carrier family 25 oxoglutarate transporter 11
MVDNKSVAITLRPYIAGGSGAIFSSICIHPIDLVKVRLHVANTAVEGRVTGLSIARNVLRNEGVLGLFSGLSAAIARQAVYGTAKIGLHDSFSQSLRRMNNGQPIPFYQKTLSAMTAGALAAVIGNPFDLALVRMEADGSAPASERRGYHNALHAIYRIAKEEGIKTLWRGSIPMICRAVAMNTGMLASYDQAKEMLLPYTGKGMSNNMWASAITSFICSFTALPFDMMKTKLMHMHVDPVTGEYPYRNLLDCARKTIRSGGFFSLWRGYWTFYARTAPHSMITLLAKDAFTSLYNKAFVN